jgi:hypothetical protein
MLSSGRTISLVDLDRDVIPKWSLIMARILLRSESHPFNTRKPLGSLCDSLVRSNETSSPLVLHHSLFLIAATVRLHLGARLDGQ